MPIPFLIPIIIGGGSAVLTAIGAKKAYDGYSDIADAKKRGKRAESKHKAAVGRVDSARGTLNRHATEFGEYKAGVVAGAMSDVLEFLKKIERKSRSKTIEALAEVGITREHFDSFRANLLEAKTVFGAAYAAAAAGTAAGKTAVVGIGLFGAASTGASIGGLYGAAATNATLAWLGGGSLAAGGGGMALGGAVLGGVVVGPAVFITGFMLASQGEKALTQVREYEYKVKVASAECDALVALLGQAHTRIDELRGVVGELEGRVRTALSELDAETWSEDSDDDIRRYQAMMLLARALGEVIRAPVLDDRGGLAGGSTNIRFKYRTLLA
jgi:hypothetical protein